MKKSLSLVIIFGICLITYLLPFNKAYVRAESSYEVELSVAYGFEGYYKLGRNTPIYVTVKNNGKDFEGVLEIEVPLEGETKYVLYTKPIHLPSGSVKTERLYIPILGNYNKVNIALVYNNQEVVSIQKSLVMGRIPSDRILIGVLSDDFNSLTYFDHLEVKQVLVNNLTLVKMDSDLFPDNAIGLEALDMIIINNYDSSELSEDQYQALKVWVNNGGRLLIGTGATYSKTLSLFQDDFLTGQIGEAGDITTNFGIDTASEITLRTQDIQVKESRPLFQEGLIQRIKKNQGIVAIASFDLGLAPMADWLGNKTMASKIMEKLISKDYIEQLYMKENGVNIWQLEKILSIVPNPSLPNMQTLIIILSVYLIVVGPVLYFLLKKLDKRQWLWITVPLVSVLFTMIIYLFGVSTRFDDPFVNKVNVVTINDDMITMDTYAGIISPNARDISIHVPTKYSANILNSYDRYYYNYANEDMEKRTLFATINMESDVTTFDFKKSTAFEANMVQIKSIPEWNGSLSVDIALLEDKFQGKVINDLGYSLEDTFIIGKNMFAIIGDLEEGETVIDLPYQWIRRIYEVEEILFPNVYRYGNTSDLSMEERISERQRSGLIDMIFEYDSFYNMDDIYLVGFSHEIEERDQISDEWEEYNTTIIIRPIELNLIHNGKIEYPLGYIRPISDESNNDGEYDMTYGFMFGKSVVLKYAIDPEVIVEHIAFDSSSQSIRFGEPFTGEIYVYNIQTDNYDLLQYERESLEEEVLSQYLNEDNELIVKMVNTEINPNNTDDEPMSIPLIEVKGRVN